MSVTLKLVLGTVNYTDYLRVSAAKVSDPGTEVFVQYIDVPVTNYVLVIPGLDPDNYYISFRDAPDVLSLGTLVSQAFVNALTGEFEYERRFYTIGSLPGGVTSTLTVLTDPYLKNKNVTGVFKEGYRYLEPDVEFSHDDAAGTITSIGSELSDGEKFIVEIKYNAGGTVGGTSAAGIFSGTITVTAAAYSVSALDKGKRFCLDCAGPVQVVTLPALSAVAVGDFVYLEHKRAGIQAQSKVIPNGADKILFNGLNIGTNELTELWVAKGESLYLRKESTYWEVIFDYAGSRVGERMSATFKGHPNWKVEDGTLYDGDEYPALYWWLRNVLPSTHCITDDTVVSGVYTHPANKKGLFVIHSTLKKFRLPNTQALSEKGLLDFDSYGADPDRGYDYPGGEQGDLNKAHTHVLQFKEGKSDDNEPGVTGKYMRKLGAAGGTNYGNDTATTDSSGGTEARVKNFGVIYLRRI